MASPGPIPPELAEIRRAAFDLRQTDPAEAVRVLRRLLRGQGEALPLAHAALAEILLDEFDDVDAALHHFGRFVELAPEVAAGHQGLGRALVKAGDARGAHEAFSAAAERLAATIRGAMASPEPAGVEEAVLALLDLALDDRELRRELVVELPPLPVADDLLEWAESQRVFDSDEDAPGELEDWSRYAGARAELAAQDAGTDAALAHLDRISTLVPLPAATRHRLRSLVQERHGTADAAADEALAAIASEPAGIDPDEALRATDLLDSVGRTREAVPVLERAHRSVLDALGGAGLPADVTRELTDARDALRDRLARASAGGPLVTLGGSLGRSR